MDEKMNCGCCREMTFEEELNSLPIDADLKKCLIKKLKQLEEDKNELISDLARCHIEMAKMKETIFKLAMEL